MNYNNKKEGKIMRKSDKKFDDKYLMEKFRVYETSGSVKVRNEIVEMNIPLVKYIVATKLSNIGIEFNELVSLGYFGLIKAVETYDIDYGSSFSTYASTCIVNYIKKELHNIINVGNKRFVYPVLNAINRIEKEYDISMYDHIDELEEILSMCNFISDSLKQRIYDYFSRNDFSLEETSVADTYEMENSIIEHMLIEEMGKCLESLPEEERELLKFRFGYYGKCYSLDEIGKIKGYTHTTIYNREKAALNKLKKKVL